MQDIKVKSPVDYRLKGRIGQRAVGVSPPAGAAEPKLLDQVRQAIRTRHYSPRTVQSLSSLASESHVSASTQNQALNAVLFLYREVLRKEIGYVNGVVRVKKPRRLPVVLTKDRYTTLPTAVKEPLLRHLERVKGQHQEDLSRGLGAVALPSALERKYPNATREWGWQWVFPATSHYTDRVTGDRRRHHLHETVMIFARSRNCSGTRMPARP